MKVICKSNNYIAIPTKNKAKLAYLLGWYLNKETCEMKLESDNIVSITCEKKPTDKSSWTSTITLKVDINYRTDYIILDEEGNLVNAVDEEQFQKLYAVLQDPESEKE